MKILTVFTGGTISCSERDGVLAPDSANGALLLTLARQAGVKAEFVTTQPYIILSENLRAADLEALRACIASRLGEGYDGVIVTHGTDTLPFAAAYLDYVFGALPLTVAIVSANYPLRDPRSNGLKNFAAAVDLIRAGVHGVFVTYRNTGAPFTEVHRGRDVLPHLPYDDSVRSLFQRTFGRIENGAFVPGSGYSGAEREDLSAYKLNGNVLFLRPYVGQRCPEIPADTKAVLLEGWHSGTLPTEDGTLKELCRAAKERGLPVYLTGCEEGFAYESKQAFASLGICVLPPLSPVAAYMKLWLSEPFSAYREEKGDA